MVLHHPHPRHGDHGHARYHGPSYVKPMVRIIFVFLAAGFVLTAAGADPVDVAQRAGVVMRDHLPAWNEENR